MKLQFWRGATTHVILFAFYSALGFGALPATASLAPDSRLKLSESYGKLPITFEVNRGQVDQAVRFVAHGRDYRIFLTDDEAVVALAASSSQHDRNAGASQTKPRAVAMRFLGANKNATFVPVHELASRSNYFIGHDPSTYITDVPHFGAVRRENLYPGIDVVFYGDQRHLEYDLIVAPGADPGAIRLAFEGADKVFIDKRGDLIIRSAHGDLVHRKPAVYQETDGQRKPISGRYEQRDGTISFKLAAYDHRKPLVIDPVVSYGSHNGGFSQSNAIAVDASGNAYVAGSVT